MITVCALTKKTFAESNATDLQYKTTIYDKNKFCSGITRQETVEKSAYH